MPSPGEITLIHRWNNLDHILSAHFVAIQYLGLVSHKYNIYWRCEDSKSPVKRSVGWRSRNADKLSSISIVSHQLAWRLDCSAEMIQSLKNSLDTLYSVWGRLNLYSLTQGWTFVWTPQQYVSDGLLFGGKDLRLVASRHMWIERRSLILRFLSDQRWNLDCCCSSRNYWSCYQSTVFTTWNSLCRVVT